MTDRSQTTPSTLPHRLALALVGVTFPLVWVGALVTTYDAGMAVPDWPNTYGYNLFLYPLSTWVYGPWELFIEHGHRLLGALAGIVSIALVAALWRWEKRDSVKALAAAALVLVIFQGVLGGMRVRFDSRTLAMVHGWVGPLFFALTLWLAMVTSPAWQSRAVQTDPAASRLQRLALLTALFAYLQLVVGSQLRHTAESMHPAVFRTALVFHLLLAAVVVVHALLLWAAVWRAAQVKGLFGLASALGVLLLLQLLLGGGAWLHKYGVPAWLAEWGVGEGFTVVARGRAQTLWRNLHVVNGSLILASSVALAVRSWGFLRSPQRAAVTHRFMSRAIA
jgi:cytochrome c oxidase assembly protein subunit 15